MPAREFIDFATSCQTFAPDLDLLLFAFGHERPPFEIDARLGLGSEFRSSCQRVVEVAVALEIGFPGLSRFGKRFRGILGIRFGGILGKGIAIVLGSGSLAGLRGAAAGSALSPALGAAPLALCCHLAALGLRVLSLLTRLALAPLFARLSRFSSLTLLILALFARLSLLTGA